jgi:hypothetical protein
MGKRKRKLRTHAREENLDRRKTGGMNFMAFMKNTVDQGERPIRKKIRS